jgi:hypothetical protein
MRLAYNMPPLGFINPFLYYIAEHTPEAFNDVVQGNIACGNIGTNLGDTKCCPYSFAAAPGWDATVGLGTPNFEIIANLVLNNATFFPDNGAYLENPTTYVTGITMQSIVKYINCVFCC